ncbi:hypothetical protein [Streptomyces sp. NPDC052015]|uniref:hypothetical protein n=1 Tax=Streptomyces sp. NPDC052015 TaxID=3154755 RepID=UPI0034250D7D
MGQPADVLRFDQVELRRWRVDDVETLHRAITESRDHLLPWMPFAATHDRKQGEGFLAYGYVPCRGVGDQSFDVAGRTIVSSV